jgi:hypothetical protein
MGFIDDKDELEKEVGIFKTINSFKDGTQSSPLDTVKSAKKNILPYLMQMLSVSCEDPGEPEIDPDDNESFDPTFSGPPPTGSLLKATGGNVGRCNALRILLEILIEFLPELIRIIKEAVKVALREALSCSSDFKLPTNISQIIDIETVDHKGILKIDPNSNLLGGIFYGNGDNDFNKFLYDLIQTPLTTETWEGANGPMLDITFIPPGQLVINLNQNYEEKSFNDFISDYMDSIELFNQKMLIGNVIDYFFSNITANLDFSLEQITDEEKTNKLLDKILDTDPCEDEVVYDDSFFEFDNEDLREIEEKSKERKNGYRSIDLGCGIFSLNLIEEGGNLVIGGLLDKIDAAKNNPTEQGKEIKKLLETVGDFAAAASPENEETIKNKLNTDFSLQLPKIFFKTSILTPKILLIYNFSNFIVNNVTITERNSYDWAKSNRVFFEYVGRESLAVLVRIFFNKLKAELMRLIARVIKKIIKNITKKKLKIIASFALPAVGAVISGLISRIPTPELAGSQYK